MKILFLNPNSSPAITRVFRKQIKMHILPGTTYDVECLPGAPEIIAGPHDNQQAISALEKQLPAIAANYSTLVLLSSLDTGFELARARDDLAVFGFTRSVLACNRARQTCLQCIVFDQRMQPLYEKLFAESGHDPVVRGIRAIEFSPADVAKRSDAVLDALRYHCQAMQNIGPEHIFIVGAVGLEFSATLRREELPVIDPVADLLAHMGLLVQ